MLNKINTYRKLGIVNLADVLFYRLKKKAGLYQKQLPVSFLPIKPLFRGDCVNRAFGDKRTIQQQADELLSGKFTFFSCQSVQLPVPPKWRCTPEGVEAGDAMTHWSAILDFNPEVGDIKRVWELSRFDWLLVLARAFCHTQEARYLDALNHWLMDWCRENPVNGGPNWKCGQEASIRVMQTLLTAFILGEHSEPQPVMVDFLLAHGQRIAPTLSYAMAQDNNHGTSEAAALFIAGVWLKRLPAKLVKSKERQSAEHFIKLGRKWLENRAKKLIENDGSFSQYSVNYHRVMLDSFSMVEFWRQQFSEPAFSCAFYKKVKAATDWLCIMTQPATGDAPNLGANDGARLFVLSDTHYRDFRPTVQLAGALFKKHRSYPAGSWDQPLSWLGIDVKKSHYLMRFSKCFDQGGYCFLSDPTSNIELYLRYPRFHFRPNQADLLHLDLWHQGRNIIRDGGSFSYNTSESWRSYFPGTASHSTVQFDNRDQMLKVSRFLFSDWLEPLKVSTIAHEAGSQDWSCSYRDAWGAEHFRKVALSSGRLMVTDMVKGFNERAVLRWRLMPGNWTLDGNQLYLDGVRLKVSSHSSFSRIELVTGLESRHYDEKTPLPVLEVEVNTCATIETIFMFEY
ncbi:alginate lyase family protein [Endozoicomonas sp. 2B-B]